MMIKCKCFVDESFKTEGPLGLLTHPVHRCNGTKERDLCVCGGDESKCDFYPHIRERAHQMIMKESLPIRLDNIITRIRELDLSGWNGVENKRYEIIQDLEDIKKILEKENINT